MSIKSHGAAGVLVGVVAVVLLVALAPGSALAFSDVPATHQYYEAVSDLSGRHIIDGFTDGSFGPAKQIARQQFAKMIVLSLAACDPATFTATTNDTFVFKDSAVLKARTKAGELYPYHYVAKAALTGLTLGYPDGYFKPDNKISRAQVITMVVRAIDTLSPGTLRTPQAGFVSSWGDFSADHAPNAAKAEANGLLEGVAPAGTSLKQVAPFDPMLRGEVAQILHNALQLLLETPTPPPGTIFALSYTFGPGGSLSGDTSQTVSSGGSGSQVTAVPADGYKFLRWSDGLTTAARTDTNVTANISVMALFASDTPTPPTPPSGDSFTLTYAFGPGGSLTGDTSQIVSSGGSGTKVTAVPGSGYHFVQWSDGLTTAGRTDSNVTADLSVTALFALDTPTPPVVTFTLTYSFGPGGSLTGDTSQTVSSGGSGTKVTAVPGSGYHFVHWSDGVTTAGRTDTNVTANISVVAIFAHD